MDSEKYQERAIGPKDTLLFALKKMDKLGVKSLLVTSQEGLFIGILSIGDIQRAIIRNEGLNTHVVDVLRPKPRVAFKDAKMDQIKDVMMKYRMEIMPVLDRSLNIVKVYFWEDLFIEKTQSPKKSFQLPVVIMAGGLGARLKPFTNIFPKPLFPFRNRTIIEDIFERFGRHGCKEFYISTNYKADLLEYYLNSLKLDCHMHFVREVKPLGTAGSLFLMKKHVDGTFFITNCDIVIDQDYSEILTYHIENKNVITIVAALKHYPIPYGILETKKDGLLGRLQEKPELTLKINTGMYILERRIIDDVPDNECFHMTQLIEKAREKGLNVGIFPVSAGSWIDIGNWGDPDEPIK